jgi:hypothetical protein
MESFADGRQEKGLGGQSDVKRDRLEKFRRDAARYREIYLYGQNQRRLEKLRSEEDLTDNYSKWNGIKDKLSLYEQEKYNQSEDKLQLNGQKDQKKTEKDPTENHSKWQGIEEGLTQIEQQRIGEYLARMRLRQGGKLSTEKIEHFFQNDVLGRVLDENKYKLFTKNNHEGTNDGQEKADSTTSKTPSSFSHPKKPNPSDPSFDRISAEQSGSTTSKDRSSFKTSTREGTNPQWHVDQATSYKQNEFVHRSDGRDRKSTESNATTPLDAWEYKEDKRVEVAQVVFSREFGMTTEGKEITKLLLELARTTEEFFGSGAGRTNKEFLGSEVSKANGEKIGNPQEVVKNKQQEIDKLMSQVAKEFDPKLVQREEVQKEEFYHRARDLQEASERAINYMKSEIKYSKSKNKYPSSMPQWSTAVPPIPVVA